MRSCRRSNLSSCFESIAPVDATAARTSRGAPLAAAVVRLGWRDRKEHAGARVIVGRQPQPSRCRVGPPPLLPARQKPARAFENRSRARERKRSRLDFAVALLDELPRDRFDDVGLIGHRYPATCAMVFCRKPSSHIITFRRGLNGRRHRQRPERAVSSPGPIPRYRRTAPSAVRTRRRNPSRSPAGAPAWSAA